MLSFQEIPSALAALDRSNNRRRQPATTLHACGRLASSGKSIVRHPAHGAASESRSCSSCRYASITCRVVTTSLAITRLKSAGAIRPFASGSIACSASVRRVATRCPSPIPSHKQQPSARFGFCDERETYGGDDNGTTGEFAGSSAVHGGWRSRSAKILGPSTCHTEEIEIPKSGLK